MRKSRRGAWYGLAGAGVRSYGDVGAVAVWSGGNARVRRVRGMRVWGRYLTDTRGLGARQANRRDRVRVTMALTKKKKKKKKQVD